MFAGGARCIIPCMSERQGDWEGGASVASPPSGVRFVVNVVVAGGDAVVGRTLELLLGSADSRVIFQPIHLVAESGLLEVADLLVLAPGLTENQEASILAKFTANRGEGASVPVVELVPELREVTEVGQRIRIPWPCRAKELERQTRRALVKAPGAHADGEA